MHLCSAGNLKSAKPVELPATQNLALTNTSSSPSPSPKPTVAIAPGKSTSLSIAKSGAVQLTMFFATCCNFVNSFRGAQGVVYFSYATKKAPLPTAPVNPNVRWFYLISKQLIVHRTERRQSRKRSDSQSGPSIERALSPRTRSGSSSTARSKSYSPRPFAPHDQTKIVNAW